MKYLKCNNLKDIMDKTTSRPVRNRKNSRKSWAHHGESHGRPQKRLFTPEIKRQLKDWLVRRRENPYPSRDEKKQLAVDTGLTYTQICNWFANWRRKLKNTCHQKKSWGNLIKNYNFSAKGNVEQFSISSGDSIWGEEHDRESLDSTSPSVINQSSDFDGQFFNPHAAEMHFNNQQFETVTMANGQNIIVPAASMLYQQNPQLAVGFMAQAQCFQISSTTGEFHLQPNFQLDNHKQTINMHHDKNFGYFANSTKFKNHIMEKYLRGLDNESNNNMDDTNNNNTNTNVGEEGNPKKPELSKWLESTANFTPSKSNYNIEWQSGVRGKHDKNNRTNKINETFAEKELIAAEALELLANNFRTKFYNS